MGKPYESELQMLAATLDWAMKANLQPLSRALAGSASSPILAVGSGGSLTAAHLLASAHRRLTGEVAAVVTPIEVTTMQRSSDVSLWLISAGGSNVDILNAFSAAIRNEPGQLVVLCGRRGSKLERTALAHRATVEYIDAEGPAGKDGFLATNSLLGFVLLLARAYIELSAESTLDISELHKQVQGDVEPWSRWLHDAERLWQKETLIVLSGSAAACGAIDLESKFTEAALGHVQVADYRNFAHGRHHWLAKRGRTSAIVAMTTPEDRALAIKTLALLPKSIPVLRADLTGGFFETSILSLLLAFRLVGSAGRARGIDPGRPGVPEFGRKLFNLRARGSRLTQAAPVLSDIEAAAIERKAGVAIAVLHRRGDLQTWRNALAQFTNQLHTTAYFAGVFDYDGTLVDTRDRFDPPRREIIRELIRLLRDGFIIGIATGRGPSVRRDLQSCISATLQRRVIVGYYNGAQVSTLDDDDCPDNREVLGEALQPLGAMLRKDLELQAIATQNDRTYQITLEPKAPLPEDRLWDLANQLIQVFGTPGISIVRSSHSVDILAPSVSKTAVFENISGMKPAGTQAQILAVGDRGRWPGNDFALLHTPCALSVDQVSVDLATCWNLSPRGVAGSEAALAHLRCLRRDRKDGTWRYCDGNLK
jgi:hydroxymethylpyrimidine pyrophosphatase-like HAD family hydrolase/fructoselysine-6-P-deglycase FrlB-like protein